jgi:hypothetical protein
MPRPVLMGRQGLFRLHYPNYIIVLNVNYDIAGVKPVNQSDNVLLEIVAVAAFYHVCRGFDNAGIFLVI